MEGQFYLLADMGRVCFDGAHALAVLCALVVLGLFALGFPGFILFYLRVGSRGAERKELEFLWKGYDPERHPYWEAIIMLRKLAMQTVSVLVADVFVQVPLYFHPFHPFQPFPPCPSYCSCGS